MNCSECQSRVTSYVDGELLPVDVDTFRAHLAGCAECTAIALTLTESKAAVRRAGNRYAAPPELRLRVLALARGETIAAGKSIAPPKTARRNLGRNWPRWAFAAAAVFIVVAGLFVAAVQRQNARKGFAELADLHVTALASANPVDVVSTDRHTVKPWFQGRIPFTFDLPELQGTPFKLVGGRVAYFRQEPGAQLLFG